MKTAVTDPVCGTSLSPAGAKCTTDGDGEHHYFCSVSCACAYQLKRQDNPPEEDTKGLAVTGNGSWFYRALSSATRPLRGYHATATGSGYQEATILVKRGYRPDTVIVKAGQPVRLTFRREEANLCSERVLFPAFGRSAVLPEGQPVPVELVVSEPGSYEFTCLMGALRGRLVVKR